MTVARNTLINLVGQATPILISLVSVPIYLNLLGEARYGVLVLVWLITGFLLFSDFGLGQAIRYEIARRQSSTKADRIEVFWTAVALSVLFGVGGAVVIAAVAQLVFGHFIEMPDDVRAEALAVWPYISAMLMMTTITATFNGSLIGQEKFLLANICKIVGKLVGNTAPLLAAIFITPRLTVVVPATAAGIAFSLALVGIAAFRSLGAPLRPSGRKKHLRTLLGYGIWTSAGSFGRQVLDYVDRFVVGSVMGAAAAALYNVPVNLASKISTGPRAFMEVLFPRIAKVELSQQVALAQRAIRANLAIGTALSVGAMFVTLPFISLWISPDFAERVSGFAPVAAVIVLGVTSFQVPAMILQAAGRPRETTTILLAVLVPFVVLLFFATEAFGLIGALAVVLARQFSDATLLSWRARLLPVFFPVLTQALILVVVAFALERQMPGLSPPAVAAKALLLALVGTWSLWVSADLRKLVVAILARVFRWRGRVAG